VRGGGVVCKQLRLNISKIPQNAKMSRCTGARARDAPSLPAPTAELSTSTTAASDTTPGPPCPACNRAPLISLKLAEALPTAHSRSLLLATAPQDASYVRYNTRIHRAQRPFPNAQTAALSPEPEQYSEESSGEEQVPAQKKGGRPAKKVEEPVEESEEEAAAGSDVESEEDVYAYFISRPTRLCADTAPDMLSRRFYRTRSSR
jgi:hypothetical protein